MTSPAAGGSQVGLLRAGWRRNATKTLTTLTSPHADRDVLSLPVWLKIVRTGATISLQRSDDGAALPGAGVEKDIGTSSSDKLVLPDDALIGLAATANGTGSMRAGLLGRERPGLPGGNQPVFRRGDTDASGSLDITDAISLLGYLFQGGADPPCLDAADTDDSGKLDISDAIGLLSFLFQGAASRPRPARTAADRTPRRPRTSRRPASTPPASRRGGAGGAGGAGRTGESPGRPAPRLRSRARGAVNSAEVVPPVRISTWPRSTLRSSRSSRRNA